MSVNDISYVGHTPLYLAYDSLGNFEYFSNDMVPNVLYPSDLRSISDLITFLKDRKSLILDGSAYPVFPEATPAVVSK
jgi:hypothetical protein